MKRCGLLIMLACLMVIFSQLGCATFANNSPFDDLKVGMSKDQVRQLAGNPDATKDNPGKHVEVWTYNLDSNYGSEYLLRFKDGSLAWWGQIQDWLMQSNYTEKPIHEEETAPYTPGIEEGIDD